MQSELARKCLRNGFEFDLLLKYNKTLPETKLKKYIGSELDAWDLVQLCETGKIPERKLTVEWVEYMREAPHKKMSLTNRTCTQLLEYIKTGEQPATRAGIYLSRKLGK